MFRLMSALLWLWLGFGFEMGALRTKAHPPDSSRDPESHIALGQSTLNEMFREVEKLMEDTQQKLEEAVHQMANETSKSLYGYNLPSSHYNPNMTEDKTAEVPQIQDSRWNELDHECLIDEDCDQDSYCLYQISSSKCTPCKPTNMECEKDEECCGEQLCVWGLCAKNKTRGQSGTICQYQSDCSPQHCCAFHRAFLFPVCRPRPQEGQRCFDHANQLLELLLWDEEAPREHCPCAADVPCQPVGQKSLCLNPKSSSNHGDMKKSP